jgi:predicted nucleotidyltransferase
VPDKHDEFANRIAEWLAGLPAVAAVSLGGSRAAGTATADSDWDFAIYYRGRFWPDDLRALGWEGEVSDLGGWGGGVFNGGAWLTIEGRRVDVHYRDLDDVEHRLAEAEAGRFEIERLLFHLAGVPTYIVVAELALNSVLVGDLLRPAYPAALRVSAPARWWAEAEQWLDYAAATHARRGHLTETAAAIGVAACQAAHAVLAARGEWVTNEKNLIDRAGLRAIDEITSGTRADPAGLQKVIDAARTLLAATVRRG